MKTTFREVKVRATRKWLENGTRRQETKTFSQTINPFNKNASGQPKTFNEIFKELSDESAAWVAERGEKLVS